MCVSSSTMRCAAVERRDASALEQVSSRWSHLEHVPRCGGQRAPSASVRQSWRQDVLAEARALTQRGLEDYARGRFREACAGLGKGIQLAPNDPRARRPAGVARQADQEVTHSRSHTRTAPPWSHPSPAFGQLTAIEADEPTSGSFPTPPPDGEWAQIDTRRVLGRN